LNGRKPLAATARRAGWIGCNILLNKIPQDARIPIVEAGNPRSAFAVPADFRRLRQLEKLKAETRGWTLDVLNVVRSLNKTEFSLADVYAHEDELAELHPKRARPRQNPPTTANPARFETPRIPWRRRVPSGLARRAVYV
jgi:hypothetical protein